MRSQPNIVMILTDQQRADTLGCYGNTVCRTPHIDRLAAEGTLCKNAFTTSAVSSPSRASLMTGLYAHNHGVMLNTHIAPSWCKGLPEDTQTFSRILRDAGYVLDYVGKWHVNNGADPTRFGFSTHEIVPNEKTVLPGSEIEVDFPGGSFLVAATNSRPKETSQTWRMCDRGIEVIRRRAQADEPFFVSINIVKPHFANVVPEPYASMYDPDDIPPWPSFGETFEKKPASHLRKHKEWHLEEKRWDWWSRVLAKYYGDVSLIDDCVGRVRAAIRDCGIDDNTIFVFSTDHGDAMGSHKHFEKGGTMYDDAYRIPLIIRTPPAWENVSRTGSFVRLMDLMPTFVEWAGTSMDSPVDAKSIVPLLKGDVPSDWPDSVYCEHHGEVWGYQSQRMVRTEKWKYAYNPTDMDELYHLASDPWEMDNLIDSPDHVDVLKEMKARLLGWNDDTGDMFQWRWIRWNFPDPVLPHESSKSTLPLTCDRD